MRPANTHRFAWMGLACLCLGSACSLAQPDDSPEIPTRRGLMRRYYEGRRVLVVYGAFNREVASAYESFAKNRVTNRSSWTVTVQSDVETTLEDLGGASVYLLGTPQSNRWIRQLAERLPFQRTEKGFRFYNRTYEHPADVLRLMYPNPVNPSYPLFLTMGNSDDQLIRYLETGRRGDFQISREGQTLAMGAFAQGETGWVVDRETFRVFEPAPEPVLVTDHFDYHVHDTSLAQSALQALAQDNEALYQHTKEFLKGAGTSSPIVHYHIYSDPETKGLITDNTQTAHYDADRAELHAALEEDARHLQRKKTAELLISLCLGKPSKRFLQRGLATYLSRSELDPKDYAYWAARIVQAGEAIPLSVLLDDEKLERESDFIADPLAGSFVAFLMEEAEFDVMARYSDWTPTASEIAALESRWLKRLEREARDRRAEIQLDRMSFPDSPATFQKGFTHAHEGYQIYNGYLSRRSDDALRELASLGTDSIAIVPYTFMRDPKKPAHLPIPRRSGSENDEGVIHSIETAKELGMAVMLKPQIWSRGSWPGDIEMTTEDDRRAFFDHYYRWIRHYAIMAELYEVEILCVGVELSQMTVGHEDVWVDMIRRLRGLYSGRLVYAANWDREFDRITFWDHLDYIGVNSYFPLSDESDPTDEELRSGFSRALEHIRSVHNRFKKPVMITEIGFTSTPAPWRQPHERNRRAPVSLEDQARCYEIAFRGLNRSTSWIRGVYWWKWPSDLNSGGRQHTGFTPNDKLAEGVVRKWYLAAW